MKYFFYKTSMVLSVLTIASLAQASYDPMDISHRCCEHTQVVSLNRALGTDRGHTILIPSTLVDALKTFTKPCKTKGEMSQFYAPLEWYRPTPKELQSLSELNFEPQHLGAALRMRAHLNEKNAPLFKEVLKGCNSDEAQHILPAAMGLTRPQLIEAANIESAFDRRIFLEFAPRPDDWVYGMLGADPIIDFFIERDIRARIDENPDRMSAFFIRNLKEGADLTRRRITGFLLQDRFLETRAEYLGYSSASNVMHALKKKHMKRPFGRAPEKFPFSESRGSITFVDTLPCCLDTMPKWTYTPSSYLNPLP